MLLDPAAQSRPDSSARSSSETHVNGAADSRIDRLAAPPGAITCPKCQSPNPAERKFCGRCGGALREACLKCGTMTPIDEAFCGSCGINIGQATAEKAEAVDATLAEAEALCGRALFDKAANLLRPIAKMDSVRLGARIVRAVEMLQGIATRKAEAQANAEAADQRARQAIAASKWAEAVEALLSIPAGLLKQEQEELLTQTQTTLEEVQQLRQEIRTGIDSGRLVGLLPKAQRLLQLQPDSAKVQQLVGQLERRQQNEEVQTAEKLIAKAKMLLKKYEYEEACRTLEDVPDSARGPEFQKIWDYASELSYLYLALRRSTVVEPSLVKLGQRLLKHAPGDARSAKIVAQLQERAARKKKTPWEIVPWAKAPEAPALGCVIDPLTGFGALEVEHLLDQPLFVEQANRLFVACGLALQGLDLAAIKTDLRPDQQRGMFSQLSTLVRRKKPVEAAWGIDLSTSGLKAVKLVRLPKEDKVRIETFDIADHAKPLDQAGNEGQRFALLIETLGKFLDRNSMEGSQVCIGMPGPQLLGRFFALPPVETKRLDDLVQYEARQQVPFPLQDLEWDYHVWFDGEGNDAVATDALLLAAKHYQVRQRISMFEDRKIEVNLVQSDCLALYNFFRYAHGDSFGLAKSGPGGSVALLDVGADATNFVACYGDRCWFRSFARGGDDATKALVRRFNLSFTQAEQLKCEPTKSQQISKVHEAWSPALDALRKDITDSTVAYELADRDRHIVRLWYSGGGMRLMGLARHLLY